MISRAPRAARRPGTVRDRQTSEQRTLSRRTRGYAHFINVEQPPALVWRALTIREWLERWYAVEAAIDARPGGRLVAKLRDGRRRDAVIDVYDEPRRLRLIYEPDAEFTAAAGRQVGAGPITEDLLVDPKPGRTVIRLLGSGVPDDAAFDAYHTRLRSSWTYWLDTLRRLLEHADPAGAPPPERRVRPRTAR